MKIVICTTPIRPEPTDYPPLGSMAIIQALRADGHAPVFYDIDCLRPSFAEVVAFFKAQAPDVVAISAVVSTAYAYTKQLALVLRAALPGVRIVVGGNLAASAEILLRFAKVDACVVGEGERVIVSLLRYFERHPDGDDDAARRAIKGLTFLDRRGDMVFTGYEEAIPADELADPDWTILEESSRIEHFITDPLERYFFARDPRSTEPHRRGKKTGLVITAKGCVARCTFCHRWDRGYRHIPVDTIVRRIRTLQERYNVGFVRFGDENFGSDRRKLEELIEAITPLDVLYNVGGVRCRSVTPDLLRKLRNSGCVSLFYGMESGSPKILEVMEKNTSLRQNVDAARWTHEAGLYTIYQLVLGMPGETKQTIRETTEFIKQVTEFLDEPPHRRLSINYIQALPGTPVYEYARAKGLIGRTLEDEERYLVEISDVNAGDDTKFLNFTTYDYFTVQSWRARILFEADAHYFRMRGWKTPPPVARAGDDARTSGYFNLKQALFRHPLFYRLCHPIMPLYLVVAVLYKDVLRLPFRRLVGYALEAVRLWRTRRETAGVTQSLRQVMRTEAGEPASASDRAMAPLRQGR